MVGGTGGIHVVGAIGGHTCQVSLLHIDQPSLHTCRSWYGGLTAKILGNHTCLCKCVCVCVCVCMCVCVCVCVAM